MKLWGIVLSLTLLFSISGVMDREGTAAQREYSDQLAAPQSEVMTSTLKASEAYQTIPLYFEENRGQTDKSVKFLSRVNGYNMFLTPSEAVLTLPFAESSTTALHIQFPGSDLDPRITGLEQLSGKVNYLIGKDPKGWHTDVPIYAKVRYENIYPGINLVFYGNQSLLEYDFVVAPGADPKTIQLAFKGVQKVSVDDQGNLILHTAKGKLIQQAPVVYQEANGKREKVSGRYEIRKEGRVGFQVAAYDSKRPLIIDPVLFYSTYLGGLAVDSGRSIVVDASGNAYVLGNTTSANFPTQGPYQVNIAGGSDVFIAKFDPSQSGAASLLYSTYLGGSGNEVPGGITIDSSGNAYVTGETASADFPVTLGAYQLAIGGGIDAFITKLNASGSGLVYSTYLGGVGTDRGNAVVLDNSNNAYVTGETASVNFPVTLGAFQTVIGGGSDAFATVLNSTGASRLYSTYIGGAANDEGRGIALDSSGNAFITGQTASLNFPFTAGAFQTANGGGADAFITKLNSVGNALVYSTYLGGSLGDGAFDIAVDTTGNAYVIGQTASNNFFTQNAFQTNMGSTLDVFVTKLNAAGNTVLYSSYLGGNQQEVGSGIALGLSGSVYVTGATNSPNFPLLDPLSGNDSLKGPSDGFIAKMDLTRSGAPSLLYSTYLGGGVADLIQDIAVDSEGNAYVTGATQQAGNFPMVNAFQTNHGGGGFDAFVSKIGIPPLTVAPDNVSVAEGSTVGVTANGGEAPYTAVSGNAGIATASVDNATITITGVSAGTTVVTVTDSLGSSVPVNVTVNAVIPPLTVSSDNVTVDAGSTVDVTVSGGQSPYTASSGNTGVATATVAASTVTIAGVVAGSTTVTVTDNLGTNVTINVTVNVVIPPLSVSPSSVSVSEGDTASVTISGGQSPYTASSGDTGVATATVAASTVTITGVAEGSTTVTVTDNLGTNVSVAVTVSAAATPTIGGADAGPNVSATIDTDTVGEFILLLSQRPPTSISGNLYISIEVPALFPGIMWFRPSEDAVPPYVQLVKTPAGFLPNAEDSFYFQGLLSPTADDIEFRVNTNGTQGLTLVFKTWYLPSGLPLDAVNLQLIQVVTINFT